MNDSQSHAILSRNKCESKGWDIVIRKLTNDDCTKTLDYLSAEPAINLFIIGDIEGFGLDVDFQEIWAEINEKNEIEGLMLRFHENFIPYSKKKDFDWTEFKKIIVQFESEIEGPVMMSGKESILNQFGDILPEYERRSTYFCELTSRSKLLLQGTENVKVATADDSKRVYDLIDNIEEFSGSINEVERIKHKIETNTGRIYYLEDKGRMMTVSQTSAENSMSAMIVGVATLPDYRKSGFMSTCLSKLCDDVLKEGKSLCLFYDNPKAGRVYHKLGFETLDMWSMISLRA